MTEGSLKLSMWTPVTPLVIYIKVDKNIIETVSNSNDLAWKVTPLDNTMGALNGKIVVTEEQLDAFSKTSGMETVKVEEHCQVFCIGFKRNQVNQ